MIASLVGRTASHSVSGSPPACVTQATWGLKPSTCSASFSRSERGTKSGK